MNDQLIWTKIEEKCIAFESSYDKYYKKQHGIYYTGLSLSYCIIERMFQSITIDKPIYKHTFLEPCGGCGHFIYAYLIYIYNHYTLSKDEILTLINNIYYCEVDINSQNFYKETVISLIYDLFQITLDSNVLNIGDGIIYDLTSDSITYTPIAYYFNIQQFDIIITNPPYKNLKAEHRHYHSKTEYLLDKEKYQMIKNDAKQRFPLSSVKSINFYYVFIEEIIKKLTHKHSIIGLLIPTSFLSNKSCSNLRESLVNNYHLNIIGCINENNEYINAQQALTYLIFDSDLSKNTTTVFPQTDDPFIVDTSKLIFKNKNYSIISLNDHEYKLIQHMSSFNALKDLKFIINKRGEFDITQDKLYISDKKTPYMLIKGKHIQRYFTNLNTSEYVLSNFINKTSKKAYIEQDRIICQQISNINKQQRLNFTFISKNNIVVNSCNFICVNTNDYHIDLFYLLGLFNSSLINWYFTKFSYNNHVSNYELDELPIPLDDLTRIKAISKLAYENIQDYSYDRDILIDILVYELFFLNNDQKSFDFLSDTLICELIENKKQQIKQNYIMNHKPYKLSDLDLEIINQIPQGGNWTYLKQDTINKSKRLLNIQNTGGRTTLYGRLDFNKPSYTITTYFNRPGNGCYIHPIHNRVLTPREAARFQTFPDTYYFYGNQKNVLNQIGNAIPTFMGFLFGKSIQKYFQSITTLDLFSGAGGFLYGMNQSECHHILANDIDQAACTTLKINNPNTRVLCGDIKQAYIKDLIIHYSIFNNVSVICGGPPCQGFSMAGFRKKDDPRNSLFIDFFDIINAVRPKLFIMENVPGLLSFDNGNTYNDILHLFNNIQYHISSDILSFNEYGIPQKRKRLFIIGVRSDLSIDPKFIFPKPLTKDPKTQITVYDTISDLTSISFQNNILNTPSQSVFQDFIRVNISYNDYLAYLLTL